MPTGIVKFFNQTKGFGFIKVDETDEEVFVHATGLTAPVRDNDKVEFKVVSDKRGNKAVDVKKV
jgi:CspA family cold shock protein